MLRGVVFFDVGTVEDSIRMGPSAPPRAWAQVVSRLLGPAPMTFNFGFPISKDDEDETQVFSFAIGTQL